MLINTHLIGKHLNKPVGKKMSEPCALCGASGQQGIPIRQTLSDGFMDTAYLGHTGSICTFCAACLGKGQEKTKWLRSTSFLATPSNLLRLKREDIWSYIFNPPSEPFVFGVTYSHKKHISFKAPVNLPGQKSYQIQTERMPVSINLGRIRPLSAIIQRWYTIRQDTKQAPTWFTKQDILTGCHNYKRIEQYGVDGYFEEDKIIEPYRNTALLELLTFSLNKQKDIYDQD